MLQRVMSINVIDLPVNISFENRLYFFLIYLFPNYLKSAFKKGIYKEYHKFEYNDNRVRGNIDIVKHLKYNIPFAGNIAYSTRELTAQNNVMLLEKVMVEAGFIPFKTEWWHFDDVDYLDYPILDIDFDELN